MKRYKSFLVFATILLVASLWFFFDDYLPIHPFCPFKRITGLPCPGCGGIRAFKLFTKGHFAEAFYTNPLSILMMFAFVIVLIGLFLDGYRNKNTFQAFIKSKWDNRILIPLLIIIIANWIWNIFKCL